MRLGIISFVGILGLWGCTTTPYNYDNLKRYNPRSILVLPPISRSTDLRATYGYYTTLTQPLAELGYYVFPLAIVDTFMKENGLPTPTEMHQISLKKIGEVINPDAVLYVTIDKYGTFYSVIDSETEVRVRAKLIHTATGTTLWEESGIGYESGTGSGGGIVAGLVGAVISQAVSSNADRAHSVSKSANENLFKKHQRGLLPGSRIHSMDPK